MFGRNLWTQAEVVEMGKFLQFGNWDRRAIRYWIKEELFPKPTAEAKGMIVLYPDHALNMAFADIGGRLQNPVKVTEEDMQMARTFVLEQARSKNITQLLQNIKDSKRVLLCRKCDGKYKKPNMQGMCNYCLAETRAEYAEEIK